MNRIGVNAVGEIRADGAGGCLLRVGSAHQIAVLEDGILTLQNLDHHRTRNHERHQVFEKRAVFVDAVERLGFCTRQVRHARCHHLQTSTLKAGINLPDNVFRNRVGFDDGECLFNSHKSLFFKSYFPAADRHETAAF